MGGIGRRTLGGAEGELRGSGICMLVGDAHCCMAETEKKIVKKLSSN